MKRKSNAIVEKECCEDEVQQSWRRNAVKRKSNPIVEKECCEEEVQHY